MGREEARAIHKRWTDKLLMLLTLPLLMMPAAPAWAHGGGTVRAQWEADGFHMIIETNETPSAGALGGTVHVTLIPIPSGGASTTRLRNLDIDVGGRGPQGGRTGPVRATQALNGAHEADLTVSKAGAWTILVRVGEGEAAQSYAFPLKVTPRLWWSDIGVVGGLLSIPVLALLGMVRRARPKPAEERTAYGA